MTAAAPRPLRAMLAAAGVRPLDVLSGDPVIRGVGLDSRSVAPGDLFLALPGQSRHGVEFVVEAVDRGAVAVLSDRPRPGDLRDSVAWIRTEAPRAAAARLAREWFDRPDEAMSLVGVTGTNGKTTVTYLIESMARAAGQSAGRIGTISYAWDGVERPAPRTTPEAPEFFRLLAEMRSSGIRVVAIEVSSHALTLERVEGTRFRVAAMTCLGRDHLDFHGSLEAYFEAKASLFERLDPASAVAVLPADRAEGAALARRTPAPVLTFGRSAAATVRLTDTSCDARGSAAVLETPLGVTRVQSGLLGRFNLDNVAAAATCAVAVGCSLEAVAEGARELRGVPGRLESVDRGQPFAVLVDYAHTPEAVREALAAVRELTVGRILAVLGCGGNRDRGKRPEMGRAAVEGADLVFVTSDNPRSEDPATIIRDIESGVAAVDGGAERSRSVLERSEAVAQAVAAARPGDTVVLLGKGHETVQECGGRTRSQDDRRLAADALRAVGFATGGSRARA